SHPARRGRSVDAGLPPALGRFGGVHRSFLTAPARWRCSRRGSRDARPTAYSFANGGANRDGDVIMKARVLVLCLITGLVAFVAPGHASAKQGGECKKVDAKGVGQDLGGGNTTATITNDGHLKGSTTAHFD